MNNNDVISNLKESVSKISESINVLTDIRDTTGTATKKLRQERRKLTSIIAKMIADKNSLETIIDEREGVDNSSFTPLDDTKTAQFLMLMNSLNLVIKADQGFDQIVVFANGIKAASEEIENITE